jgi:hypothetical protein
MIVQAALGLACLLILAGPADAAGPIRTAIHDAREVRAEKRAARQCQPAARVPASVSPAVAPLQFAQQPTPSVGGCSGGQCPATQPDRRGLFR